MSEILSFALLCAGVSFFFAGTVGLLRFPDVYTRLHALTKVDNLGLGLIVIGLLGKALRGPLLWSWCRFGCSRCLRVQPLVIWWHGLRYGLVFVRGGCRDDTAESL